MSRFIPPETPNELALDLDVWNYDEQINPDGSASIRHCHGEDGPVFEIAIRLQDGVAYTTYIERHVLAWLLYRSSANFIKKNVPKLEDWDEVEEEVAAF